MLYELHEFQRAALSPLRLVAETTRQICTSPWVPLAYTTLGRGVAGCAELLERTTRSYDKPAFGLTEVTIGGRRVAVREEAALETAFCSLRHFVRETPRADPRVLVVAPISGHHATLLRGTVADLLPRHDVYVTDWRDARDVPVDQGTFDLDDYIDQVIAFLRHLGPDTHVIAVCQPTVPVLAAVSLMAAEDDPCQPASMVLMGGPIDTRVNPTAVDSLATAHPIEWFESKLIERVPPTYAGFGRAVYPGFLQLSGFMSMNLDRHLDAHLKLLGDILTGDGEAARQHRAFYDEYFSVMDMPAEFYLQTIRSVFQDHLLPRGLMVSRGRPVRPELITRTALMTVEGENDDITGVGQCEAAQTLCASLPAAMRRHHLQPKAGHYGIFNGRHWREEILPDVDHFIREHDRTVLANEKARRDDSRGVGILVRRMREVLPA